MALGRNSAMEMHDSEVLEVHCAEDKSGFVLFGAYVFYSDGEPGRYVPQVSGWQNVRMIFSGMEVDGEIGKAGNHIYDGTLSALDYRNDGFFAIPATLSGNVCVQMNMGDDYHCLTIRADFVSIEVEGEFEGESIWDAEGNTTPFPE